jgi:hypothetical protein
MFMMMIVAAILLTASHEPMAAVASMEPSDVDGGTSPVCFRRPRRVFTQPGFAFIQDKQKVTGITPKFPKDGDSVQLSFFACGTVDDDGDVFGLVIDPNDENFLWPGITIAQDPWTIYFDSIPYFCDGNSMLLRIEEIVNGDIVDADTAIKLDNDNGKYDCGDYSKKEKKSKANVHTNPGNNGLNITNSAPTAVKGAPFSISGTTTKSSNVYGVLIPARTAAQKGTKMKPIVHQSVKHNGANWTMTFDTRGVRQGDYYIRVRHAGKGKNDPDRGSWDQKPLKLTS